MWVLEGAININYNICTKTPIPGKIRLAHITRPAPALGNTECEGIETE